jgi:hypothetical protein
VRGPAVLGHFGHDRELPDQGQCADGTDTASVATDWRLFCPKSWDDTTISDPDKAVLVRAKRDRALLGDDVREKWRLALDMLDEMIDAWGLSKLPVAADSCYGDCAGRHEPAPHTSPHRPRPLNE